MSKYFRTIVLASYEHSNRNSNCDMYLFQSTNHGSCLPRIVKILIEYGCGLKMMDTDFILNLVVNEYLDIQLLFFIKI